MRVSVPLLDPDAVDIIIPTIGRPSLGRLLAALEGCRSSITVVDDRRDQSVPIAVPARVNVAAGRARGPAAARNTGWRATHGEWVAFLDDDVVTGPGWYETLLSDLGGLDHTVGASQGRISVPLPDDRRPTDFERDVAGLAHAEWITADMAYRRAALAAVGGFDERFPRAFREDADLATRVKAAGWSLVKGARCSSHPVGPADRWVSVRRQAGNADDVLLRALYGRNWQQVTGAGGGRRRRHLVTTAAGATALGALITGHTRSAALAALGWLGGTAEFTWARIAPGPRTLDEVLTMTMTSCVLPAAATWHWLKGWVTLPSRLRGCIDQSPAASGDEAVEVDEVPRLVLVAR